MTAVEDRYLLPPRPGSIPVPPETVHKWIGDRNRGTMRCSRCGAVSGGWAGSMPCGSDPRDPKWGMFPGKQEATP